jgi:aspartyl-tRNA(Asn)/glutamyl-tRNA(Gln) amidotransferase subunit A
VIVHAGCAAPFRSQKHKGRKELAIPSTLYFQNTKLRRQIFQFRHISIFLAFIDLLRFCPRPPLDNISAAACIYHVSSMPADLTALSLAEASDLVHGQSVSPVELTRACLELIEARDTELNAFITLAANDALDQARRAETDILRGRWVGPLHGIPLALKDLVDTAGVRTTAASALYAERIPETDAEVVRRLKNAGAVLLGKTNLHEFAFGGSGVISHVGPARNPRNPAHITGGSSSGSAAAVAANFCYGAIGTDTAGSIRLPAACCGIVGLKPTFGRVSARGVIPLSWSYDHVGPMARTVRDTAMLLQVLAGYDPEDATSQQAAVPDYVYGLQQDARQLRVGVERQFFCASLDPDVSAAFKNALHRVEKVAAGLWEIAISVDEDRTVSKAETWAYHEKLVKDNPEAYQPETLRRIRACADVSTSDYIAARRSLDLMRRTAPAIFRHIDVLVTPTVPIPPPSFAELGANPDDLRPKELVLLRNTRPFNVLGLPTISIPCGATRSGLPVGLQITGRPWDEASVLCLASALEQGNQRL